VDGIRCVRLLANNPIDVVSGLFFFAASNSSCGHGTTLFGNFTPMPSFPRRLLLSILCSVCTVAATAVTSPPLSPKVNDLIDRFFTQPEFWNLQLSPDGGHVVFEREMNGQTIIATLDCRTGKPAMTAPALRQYLSDVHWIGPDQLVFAIYEDYTSVNPRDKGGGASAIEAKTKINFYAGHWVMNGDLTTMRQVPSMEHVLVLADPLPQNPSRVLFVEQSSDHFYSSLYCYDPVHEKTIRLEANPGRVVQWKTDDAGLVRVAVVAEPKGQRSFLYRETEKSAWQPLALPRDADLLTFDSTGHSLLISFPDPEGRNVMQAFDLATRQLASQPIADPVYDVDPDVIRDPRTGEARLLVYETEKQTFFSLDPGYKKIQSQLAPTFPGAVIHPLGFTQTGDALVATASDVSPLQYYLFNPQRGTLLKFLDPVPKTRGLTLAPIQPVSFKATDGSTLYGYLTLPVARSGTKPPPLIVLSHGGPHLRDTWGYDNEVQYFASLGYAVLQVNYRGSSGYGQKYALADLIEVGRQSVDDVADGIRWAIAQGHADPARVVACGGSYGGYISLALATRYPDLAKCIVGFAGVYDWEMEMKTDSEKYSELLRWRTDYNPDPKSHADGYRAISPIYQADAVKAPVLLLHGREDKRVKVDQSELMARALRKAGKSVELIRDAEGVHGLPDEKLRRAYYERVTAFLFQYAPPDTIP
jgi:dipeptidyl aminopeptidase/acylaminoacyl peptidase